MFVSFYKGIAFVWYITSPLAYSLSRIEFRHTYDQTEASYDHPKVGYMELIIYFPEPLSYKPFDLVISEYVERDDYYPESNDAGMIAGITVICTVFVALVVLLIIYCCCCKKKKNL